MFFFNQRRNFRREEYSKKLNLHRYKKIVGVHFEGIDVTRRFPLDKLAEVIDLIIFKI